MLFSPIKLYAAYREGKITHEMRDDNGVCHGQRGTCATLDELKLQELICGAQNVVLTGAIGFVELRTIKERGWSWELPEEVGI